MLSGRFTSASSRNPFSSAPIPVDNNDNDDNNNNNNNSHQDIITATTRMEPIANNNNDLLIGGPLPTLNNNTNNLLAWRERERRQRTFRVFIMFLLMLMLMDGEEPNHNQNNNNNPKDIPMQSARQKYRQRQQQQQRLRGNQKEGRDKTIKSHVLSHEVWAARQAQEATLLQLYQTHPRYHALVKKNNHTDVSTRVLSWLQRIVDAARQQQNLTVEQPVIAHIRDFDPQQEQGMETNEENKEDSLGVSSGDEIIWHYPWNTTGFYRGEWTLVSSNQSLTTDEKRMTIDDKDSDNESVFDTNQTDSNNTNLPLLLEPTDLEEIMLQRLHGEATTAQQRALSLSETQSQTPVLIGGVYLLPPHLHVKVRNDHNLTKMEWDQMTSDSNGNLYARSISTPELDQQPPSRKPNLSLTRSNGRAAFQLYSKSVPGMKEISLVDGFAKLYDHMSPGYSTRNDVLLRVRGVLLHGIGQLSLVSSNTPVTQTALVLQPASHSRLLKQQQQTREPKENPTNNATTSLNTETANTSALFSSNEEKEEENEVLIQNDKQNRKDNDASLVEETTTEAVRRRLQEAITNVNSANVEFMLKDAQFLVDQKKEKAVSDSFFDSWRPLFSSFSEQERRRTLVNDSENETNKQESAPETLPQWSDVVIPYPYVRDDDEESVRKTRTLGSRRMPHREQLLESNSMDCRFELSLQIEETEWTMEEYRTLMKHKWNEQKRLDPTNPVNRFMNDTNATMWTSAPSSRKTKKVLPSSTTPYRTTKPRKQLQSDQALVMNMVGSIQSRECNFYASINVTALRTDWEATTSKAINYSFYMMLVCLGQIVLLLRQLLHSQTQSAATRVSMVCIGWQTILDALICLGHIYLCLAMQPLFTAFASVAFFKCLIFCVIEMKYMAIIIQARNSAAGGQPTDVLRRQVAILHLRFYLALLATFIILFYVGEKYRTIYMLALYSFWLPQIVLNVVTEAKTPLHIYYIYGMSLTRMVVPLYLFGVRKNFLKEVYPEAPYDPWMCQWLILWVGFQTAILIGQSKYGARFWIPQQFLPPKYDYSRPIPPSILSNARNNTTSTTTEFVDTTVQARPSDHHATSQTTRNRMRTRHNTNNNSQHGARNGTTAEEPPTSSSPASSPSATPTKTPASAAPPTSATLDCSICYEPIDVMRQSYMLAPCDHLFHKDCLLQWMDIKMECPICRTDLPAM